MLFMLTFSTSMSASPICTRLAVPSLAILPLAVMTLEVPALLALIAVLIFCPLPPAVPDLDPVRCIPEEALPVLVTGRMICMSIVYRIGSA